MGDESSRGLTQLLGDVNAGRKGASDDLAAAVYAELRVMAERRLVREFGRDTPGVTIQPTALADDTFMKLLTQRKKYDCGGHFFAIASRTMQRVLLDYCRKRKSKKAWAVRVTLDTDVHAPAEQSDVEIEALYEALEKLAQLAPRKAEVVNYRVFWGLTVPEIAEALGFGTATIERDWSFAKVWLAKELRVAES